MTSQSNNHIRLFALSFPRKRESSSAKGLSLVELLIAIGILAVSMMLIAAAFPAGVAMSIAVSDETTSGAVFQEALSVIRDNYSISGITAQDPTDLPGTSEYSLVENDYLDSGYNPATGLLNRQYDIAGQPSTFSWSALIRRDSTSTGPMGNLCQVIIIVSRQPSGNPDFPKELGGNSTIPELRSIRCDDHNTNARTIKLDSTADFDLVSSSGYIIDSKTGIAYAIISRNDGDPADDDDNTVTVLSEPPDDVQSGPRDFWLVPGPYDGNYGRVSPAIRIFQTTLYLP